MEKTDYKIPHGIYEGETYGERLEVIGAVLKDIEENLRKYGARLTGDMVVSPVEPEVKVTIDFSPVYPWPYPKRPSGCSSQAESQEGGTSE
jgi:hypothetical protein